VDADVRAGTRDDLAEREQRREETRSPRSRARGVYDFLVTATDANGLTATDTVSVTVLQTLTTIQVSPPTTVGLYGARKHGATAYDQFGDVLVTQPSFAWSVAGGGTIDANGGFTAGGNGSGGGPFSVTRAPGEAGRERPSRSSTCRPSSWCRRRPRST